MGHLKRFPRKSWMEIHGIPGGQRKHQEERIHPIPRCWTFRNQFRLRNWVISPLSSFPTPSYSTQLPTGITRNSVRFRNWVQQEWEEIPGIQQPHAHAYTHPQDRWLYSYIVFHILILKELRSQHFLQYTHKNWWWLANWIPLVFFFPIIY